MEAGEECDYGGIRLTANPRNVLVAELKEEEGTQYRAPAIVDYETLPTGATGTDLWKDVWQQALWRLGSDGTISL